MTQTDLYESIVRRIADLSEESLQQLSQTIAFLKWQEEQWREWDDDELRFELEAEPGAPATASQPSRWIFDLIEQFEQATVTATQTAQGMEVRIAPAICALEQRLSIWQHPPTAGAAVVQYQVDVPISVSRLRFRAKVGIRDGSLIAESPDNYLAFRFYVNGVRLWSATKNTVAWDDVSVDLPTLAGQPVTLQLVTDGLGDARWNWAVWGTPLLIGE
ncbi:MAG: hypothetical protein V9H69_14290 [Anaerolineae bacterium]|jgi:hypothetical protein